MTIPIVLCQNRITGAKFVIPADRGFPDTVLKELEEFLPNEQGVYRSIRNSFFVYLTENYRYSALLEEKKSDLRGKTQIIRYTSEDVIEFCNSIEHFSLENNREIIAYAHDVQYVMGTLIHRSIVNEADKDNMQVLRRNLDEINSVVGILSGKDAFF